MCEKEEGSGTYVQVAVDLYGETYIHTYIHTYVHTYLGTRSVASFLVERSKAAMVSAGNGGVTLRKAFPT